MIPKNHCNRAENKTAEFQDIEFKRINSENATYRITTRQDTTGLMDSIKSAGLISPPILTPALARSETRFIIVAGFRRIAACRQLGHSHILARIIPSSESSELQAKPAFECARLAIADNAQQRPLNLIEQARSLILLTRCLEDEQRVIKMASPLMGIEMNPSLLKKLRKLARLPAFIQTLVLTDVISLPTALELDAFDPAVTRQYGDCFEQLKLSVSNQKEFMLLTREIARRENIPLTDVLSDPSMTQTLHDSDLNRNQKTSTIRMLLKKRRFPALTNSENAFAENVKALKLEPEVRLTPPKYFEGLEYTLTLSFRSMEELMKRKDSLERVIHHPAMKSILS